MDKQKVELAEALCIPVYCDHLQRISCNFGKKICQRNLSQAQSLIEAGWVNKKDLKVEVLSDTELKVIVDKHFATPLSTRRFPEYWVYKLVQDVLQAQLARVKKDNGI